MIEDIDMENYYDKINDAISWVVHTLNFCDNQSPISDNFVSKENYGIKTIGITDFDEKGEEKMFYSIDKVREKKYYYLISKEDFKKDKNLLNKIRESIKEKTKNSKEKIYYGIYSSEIEKNMIISVYQTMTVQNGR